MAQPYTREVCALKLRIRYEKTGVLRFIGHLDVMRFFQKAIRRAKLDVAYSQGFSPHQIISFAAPMPIGMTSEGEYFDGEFNSVTTSEEMIERLNSTMPDGMKVLDIVMLPEDAKPSMSIVSASDYYIYKNPECENENPECIFKKAGDFFKAEKIEVIKKTKTKEELTDIKPLIYDIKEYKDGIYLLLASGSKGNLKPELVMEALCSFSSIEYNRYDYMIHRLDTYMGEKDSLSGLCSVGTRF